MPIIKVPPTCLRYDPSWHPAIKNEADAMRLYSNIENDPIVVHADEVLAEDQIVMAAVYLGILEIEVLHLEEEEDFPINLEEELEYAGPSNDA